MYAFLAVVLAVLCLGVFVAIPFRFAHRTVATVTWVRTLLQRVVFTAPREVQFYRPGTDTGLVWVQTWGVIAAVLFTVVALIDGALIRNQPESITATGVNAVFAAGMSGFLMLTYLAYRTSLVRLRGSSALRRCGVERLWVVGGEQAPERLGQTLAAQAASSSSIRILDVTGHEILGRGPGVQGGLLHDALLTTVATRVSLLLLDPDSSTLDPERRKASVLQTVHAELGISAPMHRRRLQETLNAVGALNADRPPEARIEVRYYREKPTVRAMIFDDGALVSPLSRVQGDSIYFLYQPGQLAADPSFFRVFRSHFARVWASAAPVTLPAPAAHVEETDDEDEFVTVNLAAR